MLKFLIADESEEEEDWEGLDAHAEEIVKSCPVEGSERHVCFVMFRNGLRSGVIEGSE